MSIKISLPASTTSRTLLGEYAPKGAVIDLINDPRYHHPIVEALRKLQTDVWWSTGLGEGNQAHVACILPRDFCGWSCDGYYIHMNGMSRILPKELQEWCRNPCHRPLLFGLFEFEIPEDARCGRGEEYLDRLRS